MCEIPLSDACFVSFSFPDTGRGSYDGTFASGRDFCGDLGSDCVASGLTSMLRLCNLCQKETVFVG